MADYLRVVEYLRDVRSSPITQVTDELRQYAADFAELCRHSNERLRQCCTFLAQGLRSEAMQLVAEPPNLLDLVAALDLPDPSAWADLCQQYDLPLPPPLQLDRAAQLQEAYNQDQSLEELLNRHRTLALARAPINDRLSVMRQIGAADSGSAFWEKDIRTFEHARIKEMRVEAQNAIRAADAARISDLASELEQNQWLEPIPADLQSAVGDAFQRLLKMEVEGNVQHLLRDLRQAYAAKDHARCSDLINQIKTMMESAGQTAMSTSLAQELQPIVQWVQRENKLQAEREAFESACASFSRLIETNTPDAALAIAYRKLGEFEDDIPADLTERYNKALADRKRARRNKRLIQAGVAAVLVLGVLAAVYFVIQAQQGQKWARQIRAMLAQKDVIRARELIKQQEQTAPRLSASPELAAAKNETRQMEERYADDSDRLAAMLNAAGPVKTEAEAAAVADDAGAESLLATADRVGAAMGKFTDLDSLAWVDPDRKAPGMRAALAELRGRLRQRAAARLARDVDTLVSTPIPSDTDAGLSAVGMLDVKVRSMLRVDGLEAELKNALTALSAKLDQRRASLGQSRSMQDQIAALRGKSPTADGLKDALQSFVTQFPDAPISRDFKTAIDRLTQVKSIEAWQNLAKTWPSMSVTSAAAATERAQAVQAYLQANASSPLAPSATAYAGYLKQAADALGEKGTWRTGMSELLGNPMVMELSYMLTSDGKRYYTHGDIKRKDTPIAANFESIDPKNLAGKVTISVIHPRKVVTTQPALAPHSLLAQKLADEIRQIDESNWDTFGFGAIDKWAKADQLEPVFQVNIVQQLMKVNAQVIGWAITGAYDAADTAIARLAVDTIVWADPEKPVSKESRDAIAKALKRIPEGAEVKQRYLAKKAEVFKSLTLTIKGTALLMRNDAGQFAVFGAAMIPDDQIAIAIGAGQPATLVTVGKAKAGQVVVDQDVARDLPEGTMIFLVVP